MDAAISAEEVQDLGEGRKRKRNARAVLNIALLRFAFLLFPLSFFQNRSSGVRQQVKKGDGAGGHDNDNKDSA